jgi:hypothetical protein
MAGNMVFGVSGREAHETGCGYNSGREGIIGHSEREIHVYRVA